MRSLRIVALALCLVCGWAVSAQAVTVYGPGYAVSVPPYGPPPAYYYYGPAYAYGPPAPYYRYRGYSRPYHGAWHHGGQWRHQGPGHGWAHGGPHRR